MMAVLEPFFLSLWTSLVRAWAWEGVLCLEHWLGRAATLAADNHRLQEPPSCLRLPTARDHVCREGEMWLHVSRERG